MANKIMRLSLVMSVSALLLSACGGAGHNDGDTLPSQNAPYQVGYVSPEVYAAIKSDPLANRLFTSVDTISGSSELCDVKVMRMMYDTTGGAGEAATSSGVVMVPQPTGSNPQCSGARPTVLYAHGTEDNSDYDLSQFIADSTNPAAGEATLLLALFASRGYNVIAPNYAGYADSSLDYHPYLDKDQQPAEMLDALAHVRQYSADSGVVMSPDLFVTGVSQGGYVAMATHKALQAQGETVRASMPISGPYAMLSFVDTVFAGYVNGGATLFAPMLLTVMQKGHDIYTTPDEVYSADFAGTAEGSLPRIGGMSAAVQAGLLPVSAIFSGPPPVLNPPLQDFQQAGFGSPHLLADAFRTRYLTDAITQGANPVDPIRALVKASDLRTDWIPTSPVVMCGSQYDPVVYFSNAQNMAAHWNGVPTVFTLNLDETPTTPPLSNFALITQLWQGALLSGQITGLSIHGQTGAYCSMAALGFFQSQRTQ